MKWKKSARCACWFKQQQMHFDEVLAGDPPHTLDTLSHTHRERPRDTYTLAHARTLSPFLRLKRALRTQRLFIASLVEAIFHLRGFCTNAAKFHLLNVIRFKLKAASSRHFAICFCHSPFLFFVFAICHSQFVLAICQ